MKVKLKKTLLTESVLLVEGKLDDLIASNPEDKQILNGLNPSKDSKIISWLSSRFGPKKKKREVHPLRDCLPTLKKFVSKSNSIKQKWKSNKNFQEAIKASLGNKSPMDMIGLSIDEMEEVLGSLEMKKTGFEIKSSVKPEEKIGKVGEWNIWMPLTRESSCEISQFDPKTNKPKTTWCTARTSGANLFYNYVGTGDVILYYAIKDEPSSDNDWVSIGFVGGKMIADGKDGHITVNRANKGLKEADLMEVFGENYQKIISIMEKKTKALKGKHPAKVKVAKARKSVKAYKYMFYSGMGAEAQENLEDLILDEEFGWESRDYIHKDVAPEVAEYAIYNAKQRDFVRPLLFQKAYGLQEKLKKSRGNISLLKKLLGSEPDEITERAFLDLVIGNYEDDNYDEKTKISLSKEVAIYSLRKTSNVWSRRLILKYAVPEATISLVPFLGEDGYELRHLLRKRLELKTIIEVAKRYMSETLVEALIDKWTDDELSLRELEEIIKANPHEYYLRLESLSPKSILTIIDRAEITDGEGTYSLEQILLERNDLDFELILKTIESSKTDLHPNKLKRDFTPEELQHMVSKGSFYVRRLAAKSENLNKKSILALCKDKNTDIQKTIGKNKAVLSVWKEAGTVLSLSSSQNVLETMLAWPPENIPVLALEKNARLTPVHQKHVLLKLHHLLGQIGTSKSKKANNLRNIVKYLAVSGGSEEVQTSAQYLIKSFNLQESKKPKLKVKLVESENTLLGYKVVAYDDGKFYSLQHPDMEYKATVGSTEMNSKGIYLGTSEEFVKDYYTELTDMQDALLTYEYLPEDLLKGNPESEGEVLVLKAKLRKIEVLDEIDESMFREPPRHKLIKHKKEYWNPFIGAEELEEGIELPIKIKRLAQGFIVASQLAGLGQTMASPQTTPNLPSTALQRSQREMPSRDDEKIEEVAKRLMSALRKTKEKRGSGSVGDDQIKRMLRDLQKVLQSRDPRMAKQFFQQWKQLLAQLGIHSQSPQVLKSRFGLEEKTSK